MTTGINDLMATVTRLGNDQLVAQARFSLETTGMFVSPDTCKAAFIGAAHVLDLAERSANAGTLTPGEMVACQAVASLSMQIWVTLHDILTGDIPL